VTYEQAYERSQREIRELAKVAEEYRVVLALENVWNKFLLSPIEFVRYIDEIGSPFVKAYFDCGNICLYGFPQQWIRTIGSGRMDKIHVKGFTNYPHVGFPQTLLSDVPWAACREAWLEIGYDDYLTVEIGARKDDPVQSVRDYGAELSRIIVGEV
jgi:hexulose-6-phosphate isomerase